MMMVDTKKILNKIMGDKPKDTKWLFEDSDKDGVNNFKDCEPNNPNEQGFIHKAVNFVRGRGYQDDAYQKRQEQKKREEQQERERDLQRQREGFKEFKEDVRQQEAYERREEKTAKEELGRVGYGVYKGYDVLRDVGQAVVRGRKESKDFKDVSNIYDYSESAGYKLAEQQAKQEGVRGFVGKTAKAGIDVGEGVIRKVPGGAPTLDYSRETLRERPGVAVGQGIGELAMWQGVGTGLSRAIGSTGKLSRVAADTSRSGAVRNLAKAGGVVTKGTRNVVTSRPVRYASEGWTGEVFDVGQAYLGQHREIGQAVREGNLKEAGTRLAAGYAFEKAGDKAVASGFKKGLPKTATGQPDTDKFITESGSDPRISRLFERVPQKETVGQKLSRYTGVEFKSPDTRIDPEILRGTKPLKGDRWNLEGYRVKPDTKIKGVKGEKGERGEKGEKQERQERQEKMEKLEKGMRQEKPVKTGVFEPFFVPPGKLPGQGRGFNQAQFMSGFTTAAKVKDFAALRRQQANKQSSNKKVAKKIGKSLDFKKKKLKGKWI